MMQHQQVIANFKDNPDNHFLSNFYPCSVYFEDVCYPSLEHAYVASKTLDLDCRLFIQSLPKAADAKRFGRNDERKGAFPFKLKLRDDWSDPLRASIMVALVDSKYYEGSELARRLVATYPAYLIEGNRHGDTFYGQCNGVGDNHLGLILMRRRDILMGFPVLPYVVHNKASVADLQIDLF